MKKYRTSQTDFLFAKPSFLSGMARTLDMHGDFCQYNISDSSEEADVKALICDWLSYPTRSERFLETSHR
jgi:hypothetical protein